MVNFLDLDDIIGKISKKPFTKAVHHIKAEKVPVCTSVIIKNLPPDKCDEETLDLYFIVTKGNLELIITNPLRSLQIIQQ